MYCISCGARLPDGAPFCFKCGVRQMEEPVSVSPQPEGLAARRLRKGISFLDNWLAFVAVGVLATITIILFAVGSLGFTAWNVTTFMQQFCLVGPLALAALVSVRTGGLDLSVGGMMVLSSVIFAMNVSGNNAGMGFLIALTVCGALGLLNGMFIMVARVPAIFVTVASVMLTRGIAMWASGGVPIELPVEWAKMSGIAPVVALLASVGMTILVLWRTGRFAMQKKAIRGETKYFWIYGLIAAIGMLAGWAAAICFGEAGVEIGSGSSNEMILLFVFAVISASGLLKNNWVALGWVLLMAMLWTMHDQAMILLNLNPFSMMVSNASWVFILLAVMCIAKRSWKKPMWRYRVDI
jgi:ribose/xylose/arabinose/galactoside ABC-type transport system permease subunit